MSERKLLLNKGPPGATTFFEEIANFLELFGGSEDSGGLLVVMYDFSLLAQPATVSHA